MKRSLYPFAAPVVAGVLVMTSGAGFGAAPHHARQDPQTFRAGVARVRVDVQVIDRGRPVLDLRASDFEVRDNGAIVKDVELTTTTGRLSVAIALDTGRSAKRGGREELIDACHELASALLPGDRAWLIAFGQSFSLKVGPVSAPRAIRQALAEVGWGGQRSMWDAMFGAMSLVAREPGRSLVLMFTDGNDSSSWLDEARAIEVLKRAEVVVNGVQPRSVVDGFTMLEQAAKTTGGVVLQAERAAGLRQQFVELLGSFRLGYVLSWAPPDASARQGWHDIDIRLKRGRGTVRARSGYYEPGR